jgi:hypothetical protein
MEQAPTNTVEEVCTEEVGIGTQEIPVEEEMGQETDRDTQMPTTSEPSEAQGKRTGEKTSGSRKKEKAHKPPSHTSLTTDDVELVATTVEDRLSEVWENVEKHRASIFEQVQEVKTMLEKLRIRAEQQQKDQAAQTMEGRPVEERVQLTAQGSTNFIITPEMLYIDEEEVHRGPSRKCRHWTWCFPRSDKGALQTAD